jgi:adenosylcobinamide kinase/adenosylcobinamide-phosphate guanylyltransferase
VLITGGAKSGKSEFAESLAGAAEMPVVYLATMPLISGDSQLAEKIKRHKERRPATWSTIEAERDLDGVVSKLPGGASVCLLDCLSLFVANLLHDAGNQAIANKEMEKRILHQCTLLLAEMDKRSEINFLTVTNEVGSGVIPDNQLARQYIEVLGEVNKAFAREAATVWHCCVGIPTKIKGGQ